MKNQEQNTPGAVANELPGIHEYHTSKFTKESLQLFRVEHSRTENNLLNFILSNSKDNFDLILLQETLLISTLKTTLFFTLIISKANREEVLYMPKTLSIPKKLHPTLTLEATQNVLALKFTTYRVLYFQCLSSALSTLRE